MRTSSFGNHSTDVGSSRRYRQGILRIGLAVVAAGAVIGVGASTAAASSIPKTATATLPTLSIFAGNGTDTTPTPGPALSSSVGNINFGIAVDASHNVYVADDDDNYVYKITPSGTLSIFAGNGDDTSPTPGPATSSSIGDPEGLVFDKAGNLYIADDDNDYVYKVTPSGTLSIYAGNGDSGTVTTGPATSEPIGELDGLAIDPDGNLYVLSYENSQVYKVTPSGTLSVFAGIKGPDVAGTPGPATSSHLGFPEGIATDGAGNVYITDDEFSYVYKVTPGGTLSIFAGNGNDNAPTAGPATATSVGDPEYVAIDRAGNVFITDDENELVYKVTPAGMLSTYAGIEDSEAPATAGPPLNSALGEPEAIAIDPANDNLYLSDDTNYYVEKITPAPQPEGGYVLAAADGGVFAFGDAVYHGSMGAMHLNSPIVGMAATPDGGGYWLVGADGGVFAFGDAVFYGSMGGIHLNSPVVGMAATPDGDGYWLVAADGGVFAFGDAVFHGSTGGITLNSPVVGMAATGTSDGYWLVASDGGVFAFGDAPFEGSMGGIYLNSPVVAMAGTPRSDGYWLVAGDGGVFSFGTAAFEGSLGGLSLVKPVVGAATTPDALGYLMVAADGGTFALGDTTALGSLGATHLNAPIVAAATTG